MKIDTIKTPKDIKKLFNTNVRGRDTNQIYEGTVISYDTDDIHVNIIACYRPDESDNSIENFTHFSEFKFLQQENRKYFKIHGRILLLARSGSLLAFRAMPDKTNKRIFTPYRK